MTRLVRLASAAIGVALLLSSTTGVAWASWSTHSIAGGNGAGAAATVDPGPEATGVSAGGSVTLDWPSSHLSSGDAVSGYRVARYDAQTAAIETVSGGCAGIITGGSCTETGLPDGTWVYTITALVGTHWAGPEGPPSASVTTDSTAPENAITATVLSGDATQSGTTIYYRGSAPGSITLTNGLTDSSSGPASSTSAPLAGDASGWTHTPSTVSSPEGGPFVSNEFSWDAGTTGSPSETVTGRDNAGNVATTTRLFVNDSTPPTGGSVSYPDGYQSDRSVTVTFGGGADAGSGVADGQLQRAVATLTSGSCSTFSSYENVGTGSLASPVTDTDVADNFCYSYRYVITDRVGNQHIVTSAAVAKIDPYFGGPGLGSAATYSVLAGTGVTNSGPTTLAGDLGVNESGVVTGFPPGTIAGNDDEGNPAAEAAQAALSNAYDDAAARTPTATFAGDQNGQSFTPGVYRTGSEFLLTGTMTLDAQGDPNAVFVFQIDAALSTADLSRIQLVNGANAAHVYWQVAGAVNTGAESSFAGTILAAGAITLGDGSTLVGRALSRAFVTLATNTVSFSAP